MTSARHTTNAQTVVAILFARCFNEVPLAPVQTNCSWFGAVLHALHRPQEVASGHDNKSARRARTCLIYAFRPTGLHLVAAIANSLPCAFRNS